MSLNTQPLIGKDLDGGRYTLESQLGEGGMGTVYLARQRSVERLVAIKVIHPRLLLDPSLVQRFHHEAKNLAKLRSPHCVTVHDFGESRDGLLYLVMELLSGHSLQEELNASGRLAADRMISYMEQICQGLGAAHALGMVHRDLKPANINIEITSSGSPLLKVLDFGLSKIVLGDQQHEEANLTRTGQVFGTPRYMSPEQCKGSELDARTDIYSLGLIAFEALIGQPVFSGKTAVELLIAHSTMPPPDLKSIRPDLDDRVVEAIYIAIDKSRDNRWKTVDDFMAGLRGDLTGQTLVQNRNSVPEPALDNFNTKPIPVNAASAEIVPTPISQKRVVLTGILTVLLGALLASAVFNFVPPNFWSSSNTCTSDSPPPYDSAGQPCIDRHVIAYWDFDQDLIGRGPKSVPPFVPDPEISMKEPSKNISPGIFGRALRFDGEHKSRLITKRPLVLGDHFTVETWVRPSLEPKNLCPQFLFGTLHLGSTRACDLSRIRAGWALFVHRNAGDLFDVEFRYVTNQDNPSDSSKIQRMNLVGSTPLPPDKWGHIAVSSNGHSINVTVNGRTQTYARKAHILSRNAARFQFGGYPFRIDGNFSGELDAVRISSQAREIEHIQKAANRPHL